MPNAGVHGCLFRRSWCKWRQSQPHVAFAADFGNSAQGPPELQMNDRKAKSGHWVFSRVMVPYLEARDTHRFSGHPDARLGMSSALRGSLWRRGE